MLSPWITGLVAGLTAGIAGSVTGVAGVVGAVIGGATLGATLGAVAEGIQTAIAGDKFNLQGVWMGAAGGGATAGIGGVLGQLGTQVGTQVGEQVGTQVATEIVPATTSELAGPLAGTALESVGSIPAATGAAGVGEFLKQGINIAAEPFKVLKAVYEGYGPSALGEVIAEQLGGGAVAQGVGQGVSRGVTGAAYGAISNPSDPGRGALMGAGSGLVSGALNSAVRPLLPVRSPVSLAAQTDYTKWQGVPHQLPEATGDWGGPPLTLPNPGENLPLAPLNFGERLQTAALKPIPKIGGNLAASGIGMATAPAPYEPPGMAEYDPDRSLHANIYGREQQAPRAPVAFHPGRRAATPMGPMAAGSLGMPSLGSMGRGASLLGSPSMGSSSLGSSFLVPRPGMRSSRTPLPGQMRRFGY